MAFLQERHSAYDLFPAPEGGAVCELNPPPLYWLPLEKAVEYRVVVKSEDNTIVHDKKADTHLVLLQKELPAGTYFWNVYAGKDERGWQSFTVADDAAAWIIPDAAAILDAVPEALPRHVWGSTDPEDILEGKETEAAVLKRNVAIALREGMPPRPDYIHIKDRNTQRNAYTSYFKKLRQYIDRSLTACALAHHLGDKRDAVQEHIRRTMLEICSWNPEGTCAVDGPWGDEIGLTLSRCLAVTYDLCFDCFNDTEQNFIRTVILTYGRQVFRRLLADDFTAKPGISHNGRTAAYLGEMAIVLKGYMPADECREWLSYALTVYASFFPFYGGRDGGWAEGAFYASSYSKWYIPFFLLIEKYTGFSFFNRPFYRNFVHFAAHFLHPAYEMHPFGDGFWTDSIVREWQGFWAQDPFILYSDRFGDSASAAIRGLIAEPEYYDLHILDHFIPASYLQPDPEHQVTITNDRHFRDTGFVSLHSALADYTQDFGLCIRASRFGSASHQHADQGNFMLSRQGKALLCSTGNFGRFYGDTLHADWTRQTKAHNCVLINKEGQPIDSHKTVGVVEQFLSAADTCSVTVDLTGAYPLAHSYKREFFYYRRGMLLMRDIITCDAGLPVQFRLHSSIEPAVQNSGMQLALPDTTLWLILRHNGSPFINSTVTDQYDCSETEVPELYPKKQFHMEWESSPASEHCIESLFVLSPDQPELELCKDGFTVNGNRYQRF